MKKMISVLISLLCFQLSNAQTWVRTLDGISMWSLAKDCSGNVYAGASGTIRSIFKSSNGGTSWDTVLSGGASNFLCIACDSSYGVFAANVSYGVMKSSNGGLNWTNIPSSVFGSQSVNSVACGRNGFVFAGTTLGGIYRSTDGGNNFTNTALQGLTLVTIAVDRSNSNIIYAGASSGSPPNYGFYRSTDGGLTFSSNLNPYNIWGIAQRSNGDLYTVTTSSGYPFHKSTDAGLNWTTMSNLTGAMRGLCTDLSECFYAAGNGGVFKSTNDGASFSNFNLTYSSNQVICFQNKILVAVSGTSNGGVYVYNDSLVGVKQPAGLVPENYVLNQNYPNPFNPATVISYELNVPGLVRLRVNDILGKLVEVLVNQIQGPGRYEVSFSGAGLSSGIYFYELRAGEYASARKMVLVK
jgi:photosystem II stability/assembly factor-like uncharacterized protein